MNKKQIIIATISVVVLLGATLLLFANSDSQDLGQEAKEPAQSSSTAVEVDQPNQLFAVMIENSSDAWPLSGLEYARLVFEAPVEGNIPRFMAFFDDLTDVEKIGPVRSARPYYVDWANGFNATYFHVGGSPQALDQISSLPNFRDVNEFYWGQFFWRDNTRYAPHNVYTSTDLMKQAYVEREFEEQNLVSFNYVDSVSGGEEVDYLAVRFSTTSDNYVAQWIYNIDENHYQRVQGAAPQEGVQAANVIVMETDMWLIDTVGRKNVETVGDGKAYLYQQGQKFEIAWKKESDEEPLKFFDSDDNEVSLLVGSTWVEVISNFNNVQDSIE